MQELSKPFYLGSIFGSFGLGLVMALLGVAVMAAGGDDPSPAALGLICLMYPLMIYGTVVLAILVYKIWDAIQDGDVRTTPGKAIGFCFIPFFNLYWIFQAYWGWAVDFNNYVRDKAVQGAPKIPEGLVLTLCILAIASIIPFLGILISLVCMVLMAIFLNKAIDGVNAVVRHKLAT